MRNERHCATYHSAILFFHDQFNRVLHVPTPLALPSPNKTGRTPDETIDSDPVAGRRKAVTPQGVLSPEDLAQHVS